MSVPVLPPPGTAMGPTARALRRLFFAVTAVLWFVMILGRTRIALLLGLEVLADRLVLVSAVLLQLSLLPLRDVDGARAWVRAKVGELRAVPRRRLKARLLLAGCSFAFSMLFVEATFRYHTYRQFVAARYGITIVSAVSSGPTYGAYLPNLDYHWWQFDPEHKLVHSSRVRTNNFGFVSHHDYAVKRPASVYRIAVLGDSLTACVTNDTPWCDVLEQRLDADAELKRALGVERIQVFNFGQPGTGFHHFARQFAEFAAPFAPDLVLVNYIEDDFPRERLLAEGFLDRLPQGRTELVLTGTDKDLYVHVGEARLQMIGTRAGASVLDASGDPMAEPGVIPSGFLIITDEAVAKDKARVDAIKAEMARRYLGPRLLRSLRPHVLDWAFGRPFSLRYDQQFGNTVFDDVDDAVEHARAGIAAIRARHPRVLVLKNPMYDELVEHRPAPFTPRLKEVMPEQEIVMVSAYMPEVPAKEMYGWYNLPADAHWSNAGVEVYAGAIHRALSERISNLVPAR